MWALVEQRLRQLAQQLAAGNDVAPAQRYRLEGMLEVLLLGEPEAATALAERCAELLPPPSSAQVVDGRVELQLWQRRAPVTPSSTED